MILSANNVARRASLVAARASTTDRPQTTAPRPTTSNTETSNITPFHNKHDLADDSDDAFPWVVVARKFTSAIIDSWAASSPTEDDLDAFSAQLMIDAMESELEFELSPSTKEQKESVYSMFADWDAYN